MKFLLLIACSNRKIQTAKKLSAINRYDGGTYRVIRKMKREGVFPENLDIKIISAKYGLISDNSTVSYYEQKMTKCRATELKSQIEQSLNNSITDEIYSEVYIDLGKEYMTTVEECIEKFGCNFIIASGRIGERLSYLKSWLIKIKGMKTRI
jgi:cytoplasmic iron level regulating protein YaaA (DUF328/UPF0246 family)